MGRRRTSSGEADPWRLLGIRRGADAAEIAAARRRLAKTSHPDAGGSDEAMQQVNDAADRALMFSEAEPGHAEQGRAQPAPTPFRQTPFSQHPFGTTIRRDHPSFTIEALPAEAFEGLLLAGAAVGDIIHDDAPYELELALVDPVRGWCHLRLVPDAGASTVSLEVAGEPGQAPPDVGTVRQLLIDELNLLDWTSPDGPLRPC